MSSAIMMGGAPPILEMPRRWGPRVALILLLLPLSGGLLLFAAALVLGEEPDFVAAGLCGFFAVIAFVLFAWRMWAEFGRAAAIYDTGVKLTTYRGETWIGWDEISEVFFFAQRVQAGGLLGMAIRAAVDKLRSDKTMEERGFMIRLTLKGGEKKIVLTNNDKGVLAAFEEVQRRVNPRMIADVVKRARNGERVVFGKNAVTLSSMGLSFRGKQEYAWNQIEKLQIQRGILSAKITGKWLSTGAGVGTIPNLFVLTAAIGQLSGGSVNMDDVKPGVNMASGVYV